MEEDLKDSLRRHLGESSDGNIARLETLWHQLKSNNFVYQEGPYPAGHGERHIEKVLLNLCDLLVSYGGKDGLAAYQKTQLFAAAMIHDVGMMLLRPWGADGSCSQKMRSLHSHISVMRPLAVSGLSQALFTEDDADSILSIAAAHSGDMLTGPARTKMSELREYSKGTGKGYLCRCAILLRAADFLDLGPERLTRDANRQEWHESQEEHYKKHATVNAGIDAGNKVVNIHLVGRGEIQVPGMTKPIEPMERARILDRVGHEARETVSALNDSFDWTAVSWRVHVDEKLFGERLPLGSRPGFFKRIFNNEFSRWQARNGEEPFEADMMGHSLYGRFVDDKEGLNKAFLAAFELTGMHLRVLLLDPGIENQQMCEVYDGQRDSERTEEKERSILPLCDGEGRLPTDDCSGRSAFEKGDIIQTLDALRDWLPRVPEGSRLEVRATTRIMYASMSRYGNSLVVTPYRTKGLFGESQSWLYQQGSPFYDAHREVFEEIWHSRSETTVRMVKTGTGDTGYNPLEYFLPPRNSRKREKVSPLDNELFLLSTHLDRIKAVFDHVRDSNEEVIPPLEVEIQPSEQCSFHCTHCIGRHLGRRRTPPAVLECDLRSLLDFQAEGRRIERFRLSGLLGDPLSEQGRELTLDFLTQAKNGGRAVGVLTNGLALDDTSVVERLTEADYVHISLDSATPRTFRLLKRRDCFETVVQGIHELCGKVTAKSLPTQVGIGFVVTQMNAHEVQEAIDLANNIPVRYVRFKPDIRGMHALSWRNWREAEKKIKDKMATASVRIVITDPGWTHYRAPAVNRCWAQFFYSTIGADGKLYPCDHLTGNGEDASLGALGSFDQLWKTAVKKGRVGVRDPECALCPPLGWRVNRFLDQLYTLYDCNGWDLVKEWVDAALKSRDPA
ncbi:MAG: radical SAM protein [Thermodesulfobacteriota bacterium]